MNTNKKLFTTLFCLAISQAPIVLAMEESDAGANDNNSDFTVITVAAERGLSPFQDLGAAANRAVVDLAGRTARALEHRWNPRAYALDTEPVASIRTQANNAQNPGELLIIVNGDEGNGIHKVTKRFQAAISQNGNDLNASIYYANGNTTVEGLQEHLKNLTQLEAPLHAYYQTQTALLNATRRILVQQLEQKTLEAQQVVADNQTDSNK